MVAGLWPRRLAAASGPIQRLFDWGIFPLMENPPDFACFLSFWPASSSSLLCFAAAGSIVSASRTILRVGRLVHPLASSIVYCYMWLYVGALFATDCLAVICSSLLQRKYFYINVFIFMCRDYATQLAIGHQ